MASGVSAYQCPLCQAILAESLLGDPKAIKTMLCHECGRVSPIDRWLAGMWEPARLALTDSRALGGDIVGPSDVPYERDTQVIDTRRAVLLSGTDCAMMENGSDGVRLASILLHGRVNRSTDQSRVLYLTDEDGLAAIVSQLVGLAVREGGGFEERFRARMTARMTEMGEL